MDSSFGTHPHSTMLPSSSISITGISSYSHLSQQRHCAVPSGPIPPMTASWLAAQSDDGQQKQSGAPFPSSRSGCKMLDKPLPQV